MEEDVTQLEDELEEKKKLVLNINYQIQELVISIFFRSPSLQLLFCLSHQDYSFNIL